ncbi:hypothetical protein KAU45_01585 [bacterium]|nr:hypothetical protein [bacterium]
MPGKPKIIQGEWYNFVSPADPVCASSWNLPEARNIILGRETAGNAPRHIDYWSDPEFTAWLREITQA